MKNYAFILLTFIGLLGLPQVQAKSCNYTIDQEQFNYAFGDVGVQKAARVLKKLGYTLVKDEEQADYILTGYLRVSNSPWDMWSPLNPQWTFKVRQDGQEEVVVSGTIRGKVLFDSQKSRARKLRSDLRKKVPKC